MPWSIFSAAAFKQKLQYFFLLEKTCFFFSVFRAWLKDQEEASIKRLEAWVGEAKLKHVQSCRASTSSSSDEKFPWQWSNIHVDTGTVPTGCELLPVSTPRPNPGSSSALSLLQKTADWSTPTLSWLESNWGQSELLNVALSDSRLSSWGSLSFFCLFFSATTA